ncbi:MAG: 4-oxalocrotonate tautomerase [Ruminococcaceae bacterium]|nr:4-oxalocrotonate tautomerase [Oscillospiraceae bacterium]
MPYIAIKTYPKDKATKELMAEKIKDAVIEAIGCPQEAITISIEEVTPEDWQEKVFKPEIEPKKDSMIYISGKKC